MEHRGELRVRQPRALGPNSIVLPYPRTPPIERPLPGASTGAAASERTPASSTAAQLVVGAVGDVAVADALPGNVN